ncbi:hypothetical protein [Olleya marilimosa]|uniref:hypothetical protein n=1 Tax=Olleya marilimosa TaxID=272164 RepID=UPI00168D4EE7|nr:hypothetical protein [Olleya marilimosa]MBD3892169.1 hypothetical protein [Olleya marilimosa]
MKRTLKIVGIIVILIYFIGNVLPNLIGVPLAAYHSYKSWNEAGNIANEDYQPKVSTSSQSYFKNSVWIHEEDSLAGIEIKNEKWILFYKGIEIDSTDIYDFRLTDQLPEFANTELKSGEFLVLTNKSDTLNYEILGYDKEQLSLMYLPRGKIHIYKRKK